MDGPLGTCLGASRVLLPGSLENMTCFQGLPGSLDSVEQPVPLHPLPQSSAGSARSQAGGQGAWGLSLISLTSVMGIIEVLLVQVAMRF